MTQFPNDDPKLTAFLRQHQANVPPAAPELEEQIMAAIAATPVERLQTVLDRPASQKVAIPRRQRHLWLWFVPSAIVASLLTVVLAYRLPTTQTPQYANQPQKQEEDLANLEAFLERNWNGAINDAPSSEVFPAETSQQRSGS